MQSCFLVELHSFTFPYFFFDGGNGGICYFLKPRLPLILASLYFSVSLVFNYSIVKLLAATYV